jgi:hypothetical protein
MSIRRNCTCEGTNENCMFCYGSGFVEGSRQIPSSTGTPRVVCKPATPMARAPRRQYACPICNALVGKLPRHLRRVHQIPPDPPSVTTPDPAATSKVTCPASPPVPLGNHPICLECNLRFGSRGALEQHRRDKHGIGTKKRESAVPPADRRKARRHRPEKSVRSRAPVMNGSPAPKTAVRPDHLRDEIRQQKQERAMDATRDFAHNFREQGRYGSHPSHDDYGDEGNS